MTAITYTKLGVGLILFFSWLLLEYKPAPSPDIDKIKNFIQMTLVALAANMVAPVGGT